MTQTLLPCPFCGEKPLQVAGILGCDNMKCGVSCEATADGAAAKVEQWNARPAVNNHDKLVGALKRIVSGNADAVDVFPDWETACGAMAEIAEQALKQIEEGSDG